MTVEKILEEFEGRHDWRMTRTSMNKVKAFLKKALEQQDSYWKEKCEILEAEREKWWLKAKSPDECYITLEGLEEALKKQAEELKIKLPEKKEYITSNPPVTRDDIITKGFNECLDEVRKLNGVD